MKMDLPKVRVSIVLKGRTMLSEEECRKDPLKNYEKIKMRVGEGKDAETITASVRKCKPASISMTFTEDAYNHMVSKEGITPILKRELKNVKWSSMSKAQRFAAHMQQLCYDYGSTEYSVEFLD